MEFSGLALPQTVQTVQTVFIHIFYIGRQIDVYIGVWRMRIILLEIWSRDSSDKRGVKLFFTVAAL